MIEQSYEVKKALVNVKWVGKKARSIPDIFRYITVAKFKEDLNWPHEAWSIVLEFTISPKQQGNSSKARAHFLMENAPHKRLRKGSKFELYEGAALVARIDVLREIK